MALVKKYGSVKRFGARYGRKTKLKFSKNRGRAEEVSQVPLLQQDSSQEGCCRDMALQEMQCEIHRQSIFNY